MRGLFSIPRHLRFFGPIAQGEVVAHGNHSALAETMMLVKVAGPILELVGEECHTQEALGPSILKGMLQKSSTISLATMVAVDHQVLKHQHKTAFGCADRNQQIDHTNDPRIAAKHKDAPSARLFEDQSKPLHLLLSVGDEVSLLREQPMEQVRQLGQIINRGRLDAEVVRHTGRFPKLSRESSYDRSPGDLQRVLSAQALEEDVGVALVIEPLVDHACIPSLRFIQQLRPG